MKRYLLLLVPFLSGCPNDAPQPVIIGAAHRVVPVPEPALLLLLAMGLIFVTVLRFGGKDRS